MTNSRKNLSRPGIIDARARYRAATRRLRNTAVESNLPQYGDWQSDRRHDYENPSCLPVHDYEADGQNATYHRTRRHKPQYSALHTHHCEQYELQKQQGCSELRTTECLILQPAISGTSSFKFMRRFHNAGENRILALSRLSVRPYGKDRLPLEEFSRNLISEDFSGEKKICRENSIFNTILQK